MALLFSPWFWLAALLSIAVVFGTGYHQGSKHAVAHVAAQQLVVDRDARKKQLAQAKIDRQIAQRYEDAREKVRTVYVTVKEQANENINNNPNYAECGLDADGLQLYNAKPETGSKNTASGLDSALPLFARRSGWGFGHDLPEQSGTLTDVLRLPGSAQGFIGMGDTIGRNQSGRLAVFSQ